MKTRATYDREKLIEKVIIQELDRQRADIIGPKLEPNVAAYLIRDALERAGYRIHQHKARKTLRACGWLQCIAAALLIAATSASALAEPRQRRHKQRSSADYILRRQQIGAVRGTPTSRLIIGRREVDIYRDGKMFEGDNRVR